MQTIKIETEQLLKVIKENRTKHIRDYFDSYAGYREEAIKKLKEILSDAEKGKKIRTFFTLHEPENHTDDYDRIITMLEMTSDISVEIIQRDFDRYVMDNWEWTDRVSETNALYLKSNK
jgi:hypothetical protein